VHISIYPGHFTGCGSEGVKSLTLFGQLGGSESERNGYGRCSFRLLPVLKGCRWMTSVYTIGFLFLFLETQQTNDSVLELGS